jgi:hypothetical protein
MNIDKRPFYIWLAVILANVGTYFTAVIGEVYDSGAPVFSALSGVVSGYLPVFGISIFVSIIPVWLSGSKFKWRNRLGFGIPILLLLPIPYLVWHMITCTGKFCNLGDVMLIYVLGISVILFAIFYTAGKYLRVWNSKVVISIVWVEVIILVGAVAFLGYYLQADSKIAALEQQSQNATEPSQIGQTCDALPDGDRQGTCWQKAFKLYPNVDVCSWSKDAKSKSSCLFYEGLHYRETLEFGCEEHDSLASYKKKDDPSENSRLLQCWADKAKIYPELDICQWTREWNKPKCTAYFKTISR